MLEIAKHTSRKQYWGLFPYVIISHTDSMNRRFAGDLSEHQKSWKIHCELCSTIAPTDSKAALCSHQDWSPIIKKSVPTSSQRYSKSQSLETKLFSCRYHNLLYSPTLHSFLQSSSFREKGWRWDNLWSRVLKSRKYDGDEKVTLAEMLIRSHEGCLFEFLLSAEEEH